METATPLTAELRRHLRDQIDRAVRERVVTPARYACAGCGADTRATSTPVTGCKSCLNRIGRRRKRASAGDTK